LPGCAVLLLLTLLLLAEAPAGLAGRKAGPVAVRLVHAILAADLLADAGAEVDADVMLLPAGLVIPVLFAASARGSGHDA
jgi:hypothetical protein